MPIISFLSTLKKWKAFLNFFDFPGIEKGALGCNGLNFRIPSKYRNIHYQFNTSVFFLYVLSKHLEHHINKQSRLPLLNIQLPKTFCIWKTRTYIPVTEAYSESIKTSHMELFVKIVIGFQPMTIFCKKLHLWSLTGLNMPLMNSNWHI